MTDASTILVATDFSQPSELALKFAAAQAKLARARLLILHVYPVPPIGQGEGLMHHGLRNDGFEEAERRLRALDPEVGDVEVDHRIVKGEPADEILRVAEDAAASLIVMGTHGRSGLLRALMGSVAEKVLRGSSRPVVTVRVPAALT